MKVLLLLALAAVGQCALLGSKKCTYGPSYWCSHVGHAKECGAMQHCMATVWKNQQVDMIGSTETCFDAIKVLDVVRHVSDFDLKEQWLMGCTGMQFGKRQPCKGLIKTNIHEVSMLLKSDLSSKQVAAALNLCGGFSDSVSHTEGKLMATGDYCTDCENFMGDLRQIFNNSVEQLKDMIKSQLCTQFSSLTDVCDELVDAYGDIVFNLVVQKLDPKVICQALRMCDNQVHTEVMKSLKYILAQRKLNSAVCDVCKDVAKVIDDALKSTDFQNEMTTELENEVCPLLGSFAAQCKSYVEQYAPLVFQIAIAEMDPNTFCGTVGLCNETKSVQEKTHMPLAFPVGTVRILAPERESSNSLQCDLCEVIVKKFKEEIDGKTAEEAKEILEKLCKDLPDEFSGACAAFVDEYADKIIEMLLNKVDPDEVCKAIGECSSAKVLPAVTMPAAVKGSEECTICKFVMTEVQKELNSTGAKTLEKEVLDKICSYTGNYKAACQLFVDQYYPAIANLIVEEVDPNQLCLIVRLCGQAEKESQQGSDLKFAPMMTLRPAAKHYVLGANKCMFGPSFWCATEENMKMCKAENACKRIREKELNENKINA